MARSDTITRRNFFSRAAIFASGGVLARELLRAADAPRAIGLGFSLYGMKSLSIAAALQAISDIGYDCVELPVMPDWPADSARMDSSARRSLRAHLAERGLRLTALMENLPALGDDAQHRTHLDRLKRAAEFARDLARDDRAPLVETILGGRAGEFDAVKDRLASRLGDYAAVMSQARVVLAIKAHVGNATQRPEQLLWLLDRVASPWLKAAYDYSHFELQGLDLGQTLSSLLPQTVFVHVKDTEHARGKRGFLLPGEGTIDYVSLLKQLRASYHGDVVVEVSSQVSSRPNYDPLAAATRCYNHLAGAFTKAGVQHK